VSADSGSSPDPRRLAVAEIEESIAVKQAMIEPLADSIVEAADWVATCLRSGGKLLLFGNGGSAADAQHIAAELVGRFRRERRALPALALTTDTSVLTALANDSGVEALFARQVEALGREGDVAIALSTSGESANVVAAIQSAGASGIRTIGLTGEAGGRVAELCDLTLRVPSAVTARIQEAHILIGHVVCELVERALAEG
jgi:D-sedoheptulose 7-phosphate isomerase